VSRRTFSPQTIGGGNRVQCVGRALMLIVQTDRRRCRFDSPRDTTACSKRGGVELLWQVAPNSTTAVPSAQKICSRVSPDNSIIANFRFHRVEVGWSRAQSSTAGRGTAGCNCSPVTSAWPTTISTGCYKSLSRPTTIAAHIAPAFVWGRFSRRAEISKARANMRGGPRIELVGRELALAAQQLETFRGHDEMQKTLLGADRAVALGYVRQVGGDAKSKPPAMAAPFKRSHALHPFSARAHRR
jgi:hypothetical protein